MVFECQRESLPLVGEGLRGLLRKKSILLFGCVHPLPCPPLKGEGASDQSRLTA
jgi:hypothetical protein